MGGAGHGRRDFLQTLNYGGVSRRLAHRLRGTFVLLPRRNPCGSLPPLSSENLAGGTWRMGGVCEYWFKTAPATI